MARCSPSGAHSSHGASRTAARDKRSGTRRAEKREARRQERAQGGGRSRNGETAPGAKGPRQRNQDQEPGSGPTRTRNTGRHPEQESRREAVATPREPRGNEGPPPGPRPATPERANDITPGGRAPWRSAAPGPCGQEEADGPRAPAGDAAQEVPRPDHPATQCRRPQEGLSRDAKQPTQQQPLPGGVRRR